MHPVPADPWEMRVGGGKAEPPGSKAAVEETWLPGNWLVTKEAEGQGEEAPAGKAPRSFCCRHWP